LDPDKPKASIEEVLHGQGLERNVIATPEDEIEDKWSDARFRKKHGLGPDDLRAIGTVRRFGNGKMLVMANGPKHSTTYRLYKVKGEMAGFNVPGLPDLLEDRIGMEEIETVETEKKGKKGKPSFKYGPEHARGIQGVAWYVVESALRDFPDYFPRAVDLVKPKTKPSDFPVTKYDEEGVPVGRMKIVNSVIKIRWEINGESVSSWESRETARRVFEGKGVADEKIFTAAQVQEGDFEEWLKNPQSPERSGTPWRSGLEPTPERELTPGLMSDRGGTPASLARSSRARTPGPKVMIQEPNPGGKIDLMSRDAWIKEFLEIKGITDPASMSPQQDANMMQSWRLYSATMAVA
jgi:hypothetical protein